MPPSSDPTQRRRKPRQERAEETVDALVEATEQLLRAGGYDSVSTNRVAKRAGVSIGSLYQYFPGKEALVAAVIERRAADTRARLAQVLREHREASLEDAIRAIVKMYLGRYREDRDLYVAILPVIDLVRRQELVTQQIEGIVSWMASGLEQVRGRVRRGDARVAAFVLVSALEGVARRSVTCRGPWTDGDVLTDEFTDLVLRYLLKDPG